MKRREVLKGAGRCVVGGAAAVALPTAAAPVETGDLLYVGSDGATALALPAVDAYHQQLLEQHALELLARARRIG